MTHKELSRFTHEELKIFTHGDIKDLSLDEMIKLINLRIGTIERKETITPTNKFILDVIKGILINVSSNTIITTDWIDLASKIAINPNWTDFASNIATSTDLKDGLLKVWDFLLSFTQL